MTHLLAKLVRVFCEKSRTIEHAKNGLYCTELRPFALPLWRVPGTRWHLTLVKQLVAHTPIIFSFFQKTGSSETGSWARQDLPGTCLDKQETQDFGES